MIRECGEINFICRGKTHDTNIITDVVILNKYKVPDKMNGMTVIDIGANIGSFTVLCAHKGATVYALEPYSDNYEMLVDNVSLNSVQDKVHCMNVGLGDGETGKLFIDKKRPDFCSLDITVNGGNELLTERVKTITLKALLELAGDCDFLKCDAEGAEKWLCKELQQGLYKQVKTVAIELHYWKDEEHHKGSIEKEILNQLYEKRVDISEYEGIWSQPV